MAAFGGFNFATGSNTAVAAPTSTAAAPAATAGFSFGLGSNTAQNPAPAAAAAPVGGFQFNAPAATSTATVTGFGAAAAPAANPLFGGASSITVSNPLLGGAPAPTATGFFAAGNKPATAVAPVASTGGGFNFGTVQQQPASTGGLSLGIASGISTAAPTAAAATTAAGTGGLFGGVIGTYNTTAVAPAVAPSATTPFNFAGIGGAATATNIIAATSIASSGASVGLGGPSVPTLGLGGSQPPAAATGEVAGSKSEGKPTKETPLPQEIFATIAAFESFKSVEKAASEANLRQSAAAFHKLGEDCKKLRNHVTQLATLHASLQHRVNTLKEKIIKNSDDVEMGRRTQNTPTHLQGDNMAPEQYFSKAVQGFEAHMRACRQRIEEVEKCLAVAGQAHNNEADLRDLVRRQHNDLQVAASHVYKLHAKLIQLNKLLPCPEHLKPKPMFRPGVGDMSRLDAHADATKSAVPKESAVIRSCFDMPGGESRLGIFQMNMAKARALSLNPAPPPTLPLQAQQPLFGSSTPFGGGSGLGLQQNNTGGAFGATNFGTGTNFGSGTSSFGLGATNINSSAFGTGTSAFGTGTSAFGTGTSGFGSGTSFGGGTSGFGTGAPAFGTGGTSAFGSTNTGTSSAFGAGTSNFGAGSNNNNSSFGFSTPNNANNNTQAGSLFSSTFGQSNKLFSGGEEDTRRKRRL